MCLAVDAIERIVKIIPMINDDPKFCLLHKLTRMFFCILYFFSFKN